uniref:Uncharacterized protein n=1 Tax=Cladonia uncialis subsp. uncialis TaxID=180999 RepID=A0A2K9YDT1_CLAUC|nr:hypothetical protein [Cladonia uncialis subsp. uncialis]
MSSFTSVPRDGSYFDELDRANFDPFAIFGLRADDDDLSQRDVQRHFKHRLVQHVFERAGGVAQSHIPTWKHANAAKDMLFGTEVSMGPFRADDPFWVGSDDDGDDNDHDQDHNRTTSSPLAPEPMPKAKRTRRKRPALTQTTPANPRSAGPQRYKPKGTLVGRWKHVGLPAGAEPKAVYASRGWDGGSTAGSPNHGDIEYLPRYRNLGKQEVDSHIHTSPGRG